MRKDMNLDAECRRTSEKLDPQRVHVLIADLGEDAVILEDVKRIAAARAIIDKPSKLHGSYITQRHSAQLTDDVIYDDANIAFGHL